LADIFADNQASGGRSIGAILVDSGRLSPDDAACILRFQKEQGIRFGEAAVELGLLTREDIRFALARQFDFPCVAEDDTRLDRTLVAAYRPDTPIVEQLRALRSQLVLRWFEASPVPNRVATTPRKVLAIVSPGKQDGRSFIAANLAIVFTQLGERTLLIDADLRAPTQHNLFALGAGPGLSGMLSGRAGGEAIVRAPALRSLSILPAGPLPPNPQELLSRSTFSDVLDIATRHHDIVLIDTPAAGSNADALTVAIRAGGALMVARKNQSSLPAFRTLARNLHASCTVVGSVLNDA
jgi:chain length determinant protein tyrosine kinase EpsG